MRYKIFLVATAAISLITGLSFILGGLELL